MTQNYQYYLVIGAIFKDESHIIREWITYYLSKGVEHFFLINNGSRDLDTFNDQIRPYSKYCTIFSDPTPNRQIEHYNNYLLNLFKTKSKWCLVVDLDEFVYSPLDEEWKKMLEKFTHVGGIAIPWVMFGSSNLVSQPESVISNFIYRADYSESKMTGIKCFYQSKYLVKLLIHSAVIERPFFIINTKNMTRVTADQIELSETDLTDKRFLWVINHYAVQSKEFFIKVKMTRGDVMNRQHNFLRNLDYFKQFDKNQVLDTNLKRQFKQSKITNHHQKYYIIGSIPTNLPSCLEKFKSNITWDPVFHTYPGNKIAKIAQEYRQYIFILVDPPKHLTNQSNQYIINYRIVSNLLEISSILNR